MGGKQKIKSESRNENRKTPTRIVVERVYLGGQSMEDAFRPIRENIEEIMEKSV